ncbi:MAG: response regulator [Verrucomicrobia bacterium]|nr:response regulator [Cytophagales bacterium]
MNDITKKLILFIVDDDDTSRFILKKYIDRRKIFDIQSYDSGEACMSNIHLNPEVVILDYNLTQSGSRMNGRDVVLSIKKSAKILPRIVMLSGQDDGKIVLELINEGVRDYVIKGDNAFSELDEILDNYLAEKQS